MKSRIRSIKPEILQDEELWDLGVETGWPVLQAFVGLWMYADREGRFEWRPRKLRPLLLPYWEGVDQSFSRLLDVLERERFIVRYEVDGKSYGYVRKFREHQVINQREAPSTLPPPPATDAHVHARAEPSPEPVHAHGEGKGRELERKGEGTTREHASTPTLPEVPGLVKTQPNSSSSPNGSHPHPLRPSRREQAREAEAARLGVTPTLRDRFDPDWEPNEDHRVRGFELGLTETQMLERAEDCRRKPIKHGFTTEDDHFFRELSWLAADLKTKRSKETRHDRERFETPGADRAAR